MKITMYELIGLVKDDKAPKKIVYNDIELEYDKDTRDYYPYYDKYLFEYKFADCVDFLEDEVEIIDKPKTIEKILISMDNNSMPFVGNSQYKRLSYSEIDLMMATKINELIDEINKLKEKQEYE